MSFWQNDRLGTEALTFPVMMIFPPVIHKHLHVILHPLLQVLTRKLIDHIGSELGKVLVSLSR